MHIRLRILDGIVDRNAYVRLRGEVEHGLRPELGEQVLERLADVTHLEGGGGGDVVALPLHERVDDHDLVAAREERVHDVGADEPGPACDDGSHCAASYGGCRSRRS